MEKVLVVATHPDDETLGCGGALLKHKSQGDEIHWLICTELRESEGFSPDRIASRRQEINHVKDLYAFDGVYDLNIPTMQVDTFSMSDLVGRVSKIIREVRPNILYLPFKSDVHSDHRKIFEAVFSCTKSFRYPFIKKIMMMETLSETEFAPSTKEDYFAPDIFVDITDFFDRKVNIMKVFKSELGEFPFPRSVENIEALAKYRGATCGCRYAESFMLLKEIW